MNLQLMIALAATGLVFASPAFAHSGHEHAPMPKEFDTLKQLVGTWEGKSKEGPIKVVYELTSGGTVISEKLMPGTPHEMVSMYFKDGNSLAMTHYCAEGNHPQMSLMKAEPKKIAFEMTKPIGVTSMNESHMHAITLSMPDADTLHQEWVFYEKGKKAGTTEFDFKRKK